MPRIYTEIRIAHKTIEEKIAYEKALDQTLQGLQYKSRSEWLNAKFRADRIKYLNELRESQK